MRNLNRYILTDQAILDQLLKKIGEKYKIIENKKTKRSLEYLDTFDWRIYLNGWVLKKQPAGYSLMSLDEKTTAASLKLHGKKHLKFWWDFPDSLLKSKLIPVIDVRALLPVAAISIEMRNYKIISDVRRNVASLSVQEYKLQCDEKRETIVTVMELNPSRNVLSEYLELLGILRSCSIDTVEDIYFRCLSAAGKTVCDYNSKIEINIDPQLRAPDAAKNILRLLFDVMLKNEEGIRMNTDIEFLHDYRVAVRRTRTILGQLKGIFPQATASKLKSEFSKLGKLSNEARDLDIYLLRKAKYESMLPGYFTDSLSPLFEHLKKRCKSEHVKLIRWLKSASYTEFKTTYTVFLNEKNNEMQNSENSDIPIGKLATEAIITKYNQVIEYGSRITKETPDEDLHRLRIECKKLRYLLELFSSIYTPKKVNSLIAQLKKLQTNLGDFNDMFIQQESLKAYLEVIPPNDKNYLYTAAAIGGLISHLHNEREKARKSFHKTFANFHKSSAKRIEKDLNQY